MIAMLFLVTTCFFPLGVLIVHSFFHRPENPVVQICAVHFVWNSAVIGHGAIALPFLIFQKQNAVHDYLIFMILIVAPLEVLTGAVKIFLSKHKIRFCWRHRMILGFAVVHLAIFYFARAVRPDSLWLTLLCTFLFYGYAGSYLPANPEGDGPEITGSREWPALKKFLSPILFEPIFRYLNFRIIIDTTPDHHHGRLDYDTSKIEDHILAASRELKSLNGRLPKSHPLREAEALLRRASDVIGEGSDPTMLLEKTETAVFGFHIHGIIPFTAALMTLRREFPKSVVATDAMCHAIAWMRDLAQWLGARECTRDCIAKTLQTTSVVLVPGGQAEILMNYSEKNIIKVYTGHKGFIKLAKNLKTRLVPVFSFGEWELLDNIRLPKLQKFTRRILGFPLPFLPIGVYGLPFPRKPPRGITVVVGRPLDVEHYPDADAVHAAYYARLRSLVDKYKSDAGYPHLTLLMCPARAGLLRGPLSAGKSD
ncbi:hypothetical protein CTAYLR_004472 [Chrysophaeum taylorii]|uniref:Acyltransferase n=1 Tax=Chrysophaeum taylorii TaxID=2483200 RepID=A0AAD7XRR2_9STRA|nr:hypothetical protein CTAYLR_004420 [Chrysophaeum taylorii]KAJ8613628.1 hypothetical protein CTAYLR_004472 [Chrysophaeum taylorii]